MSLIPCPECGKEVSSQAESCIGCGMPSQNSSEQLELEAGGTLSWKAISLWVLFVPLAIATFWTGNYAWGVLSNSQCTFVAQNSSNRASFDDAFLCFNDLSVYAARFLGVEVFDRDSFILTMGALSVTLGLAAGAVFLAARQAKKNQ
jgi:hypothetical protein